MNFKRTPWFHQTEPHPLESIRLIEPQKPKPCALKRVFITTNVVPHNLLETNCQARQVRQENLLDSEQASALTDFLFKSQRIRIIAVRDVCLA